MGRTVYWMNVSMDGYIDHEPGEAGGGSWMRIDDELHREFNARARELSLSIEGRVIYETMESFWPAARDDDSLPEVLREYGHIWCEAQKVLLSSTRTEASHNTRVVGGADAIEQVARIREETDGLIGVGGATVATSLLRAGLLDELLLFTHPVLLGRGRPLFDSLEEPLQCDLVEQATYGQGVAMHRYEVRRPT